MKTTEKDVYSSKKLETKAKAKKVLKYIIAVCSVMAIVVGIFGICFSRCSKGIEAPDNSITTGFETDENAVEGGWVSADEEKIQEELNSQVEAGYINISMNTTPVFEDGSSEGNLMIVNETINNYPQKVYISRNDTDELIYTSKGIPVGSKIEKAKLDVNLPAGTYECTAMFHNVDPDTGDSLGCAGATIYITVKN